MKTSVNTEIKTYIFTKRIIMMFAAFTVWFFIVTISCYNVFLTVNDSFNRSEKRYGSREAFMEALETPLSERGVNYLAVDKYRAESLLHSLSPEHSLTQCMEAGLFGFPLLLTIFGVICIYTDQKNNVLRTRVAREGKMKYYISKQVVLFACTLITVAPAILLDTVLSAVLYKMAKSRVVSEFIDVSGTGFDNSGNDIVAILFFILSIIVFLELGFCLAYILKSSIIAVLIVTVIWYLNPISLKYGPVNAFNNAALSLFDYQGTIAVNCVEISRFSCWLIIILVAVLPCGISSIIMRYRSAYK